MRSFDLAPLYRATVGFDLPPLGEYAVGIAFLPADENERAARVDEFAKIADEEGTSEVELRCSWSPLWDPEDADDVRAHLDAMCDLLAMMAGLPPSTGVVSLSSRLR